MFMAIENKNIISCEEEKLKAILKEVVLEVISESGLKTHLHFQKDFGDIYFAMEVTGLAKSTIYNKCNKGDFPHYKKGKLYFLKSELENYMKSKNFKNDDIDITKYLK